jgi:hypothetical protein
VNRTVLSAHRAVHDPRRHAALGGLLAALGFDAQEVRGRWHGHVELSWEVAHMPSRVALLLARAFGQDAVLSNGHLYRLAGRPGGTEWAQPIVRIEEHDDRCRADGCTHRRDGRSWHAVLGPARPVPGGALGPAFGPGIPRGRRA